MNEAIDSGRLLTINKWLDSIGCDRCYRKDMKEAYQKTIPELKAQDAKTASLKDAEWKQHEQQRVERIKNSGVVISLENIDGRPVVMFPDGDYFEQTKELVSFLMHLSILMPHCDLPDKLLIIPEEALKKQEGIK